MGKKKIEKLLDYLKEYHDQNPNSWLRYKDSLSYNDKWELDFELPFTFELFFTLFFGGGSNFINRLIEGKNNFIDRLIKNDKINDKADNDIRFLCNQKYSKKEALLMILAVVENPIEFLISVLK